MHRLKAREVEASRPRNQMMRVIMGSRPGAFGLNDFAGEAAVMEDSAGRRMVADLLRDRHRADWRGHSARRIANAKLRGRNRIGGHLRAVLQKHQLLILHADDDLVLDLRRSIRVRERKTKSEKQRRADQRSMRAFFSRFRSIVTRES